MKQTVFLIPLLAVIFVGCSTTHDNAYYRTVASPEMAAAGERIPPTVQKLQKTNKPNRPTLSNPQKPLPTPTPATNFE